MSSYDVSARSTARPATVYALLEDVETWTEWQPQFETIELAGAEPGATSGPTTVGAVWVLRHGSATTRMRVVDLVPDRRLGYLVLDENLWRDYRATIDLTPAEGAGGTHIRWHTTFRPRVPGTGRLWEWYLHRYMRPVVDSLARHAAAQEQGASAGSED